MDKTIIDRLEDIRNRVIQAQEMFSLANNDLLVALEGLDEDFKSNLKFYVKDDDYFEQYDEDTDTIVAEMFILENSIDNLSKGIKWYLAEQNDESMTFEEFKALALASKKQSADLVYEVKKYRIENRLQDAPSPMMYDLMGTGISKSLYDARIAIFKEKRYIGNYECGIFYEIIEKRFNSIGDYHYVRRWLINGLGEILDYLDSDDSRYLFRGYETVRFKSGEIVLCINYRNNTVEPCVVIESPYTIVDCWELNNRLRDECHENGKAYTKGVYEQKIKGKDCYQIHTISGKTYDDCSPISLLRINKPRYIPNEWCYEPSSEQYKYLKTWYDDYISKVKDR